MPRRGVQRKPTGDGTDLFMMAEMCGDKDDAPPAARGGKKPEANKEEGKETAESK